MRLYKSSVCSILTYGSEAWRLTTDVRVVLNGSNASMVSVISGKSIREESTDGKLFDLVKWIRARRLQWLGHILRMTQEQKIKQAIYVMFKSPQPGDILMDAPQTRSWRELCTYACDRDYWRARVRALRQPRVVVQLGSHREPSMELSFKVS